MSWMGSSNSSIRLLLKWLLVPLGLGAFGYYVVGPRFSQTAPKGIQDKLQRVASEVGGIGSKSGTDSPSSGGTGTDSQQSDTGSKPAAPKQTPPAPRNEGVSQTAGPDVSISVQPASPETTGTTPSRRHHKVRRQPPQDNSDSADSGSYGGTDEGSTTPN